MIVIGIVCFCMGASFGVLLAGLLASASLESPSPFADPTRCSTVVTPLRPAAEVAGRISDQLIHDFHVYRDEFGVEHVIPTQPPDTAA